MRRKVAPSVQGESIGDFRYRTFFAILPVTIGDEQRWLETITVQQQLTMCYVGSASWYTEWQNIQFIDDAF